MDNEEVYDSQPQDVIEEQPSIKASATSIKSQVKDPFAENNNLNYDRYDNKFSQNYNKYFNANYSYITETENQLKTDFKQLLNVEEVNIFFDLELDKNIKDVEFNFHFEGFNAKEDPPLVKDLLEECIEILNSNKTNLDVDVKTVEQVPGLFL